MPPKKTAKKAPAKKAATSSTSAPAPEPMDSTIVERPAEQVGAAVNHPRVCYALKTLVAEFDSLFPETPVEYSDRDGRNTALSATFDLTTLDNEDAILACRLLGLVSSDPRVDSVISEDTAFYVLIRRGALVQDSREPFGLTDAWSIMVDEADPTIPVLTGTPDAGSLDPLTAPLSNDSALRDGLRSW